MLRSVSAVSATTPPVLSRTTPVMAPLKLWAEALAAPHAKTTDARQASHKRRHEGMSPPGFELDAPDMTDEAHWNNTDVLMRQYALRPSARKPAEPQRLHGSVSTAPRRYKNAR